MRTTYIKPNSHTQRQAMAAKSARDRILEITGLSRDEWTAHMFELGYRFAMAKIQPAWHAYDRLTDEQYGYWSWWLNEWLEDDKEILAIYRPSEIRTKYLELKKDMTR